jgi:hypothetical protein
VPPGRSNGCSKPSHDRVLSNEERERFLTKNVIVEEKLDGSNVRLYRGLGGKIAAEGRAGPDALDRGRQLGRLRAWVGERTTALELLSDGECLFGEWLYRRHAVKYDHLPDLLVVFDLYVRGEPAPRCTSGRRTAPSTRAAPVALGK